MTNVSQFLIFSLTDTDAIVTCRDNVNFSFESIHKIIISGVKFRGCGGNRIQSVHQSAIEHSTFFGKTNSKTFLTIVESSINITDSTFSSNTASS